MNKTFTRRMGLYLALLLTVYLSAPATLAAEPEPTAPLTAPNLDDLFAEPGVRDVAVSPSGRYVGVVFRRKDDDLLVLMDLTTGENRGLTRIGKHDVGPHLDSRITTVFWKSEERLLFRVSVYPADGVSWARLRNGGYRKLGNRLFAIGRDGKNLVRMLGQNRDAELDWAFDLGSIRSMLPNDPDHILMVISGEDGRSLFKVNVLTGVGEVNEPANLSAWDWWLDMDGRPIVRVEVSSGTIRFYRRELGEKWKKYYSVRLRELKGNNEYEPLGPSDQPDKYYVLARPEGAQRRGVYLYDLTNESFGPPVAENPQFDIITATVSRDGKRVQRFCFLAHVRICESTDEKLNMHMKGVRKYFKDSANVYLSDASEDNQTLMLYVEGPSDSPGYYQYQLSKRQIVLIGFVNDSMSNKRMPSAGLIEYQGRDGTALTGYLTRPYGAGAAKRLPLIMMPHGGPEARDHLEFDLYVQFLAARGYAVFQPNFRGSDGFGRSFAESGYGQWGRKMQDDISDAVALLAEQGVVDPQRVCIVGASYGGYAALAGATLTPDLYKCVVSIAGIANLSDFLKSRRRKHGADSELYSYWKKQIGDPEADAELITSVSPAEHIDRVKAPILLIHGDADVIVPIDQSLQMKKLLDKSGRKTELITLKDEGHSDWSEESVRRTLNALDAFLLDKIGPGFGTQQETPK